MNKPVRSAQLPLCRWYAQAWHDKGTVQWTNVLVLFTGQGLEEDWSLWSGRSLILGKWPRGYTWGSSSELSFSPPWGKRVPDPDTLPGLGAIFPLRGPR
jgi:hypothetical protein